MTQNGRTYHFSRDQLEACTLRTGQRANPDSFVLVAEDPPRFVRGDDYNAAMDAGPRILAFIKEQFDIGVEVNQSDIWSDGIPIEYSGQVKVSEQQRIRDGILVCGAKKAVVRVGHAPGVLDIEYTLPDDTCRTLPRRHRRGAVEVINGKTPLVYRITWSMQSASNSAWVVVRDQAASFSGPIRSRP